MNPLLEARLKIKDIAALIPHRHPFLFVDGIIDFEQNLWIRGVKRIGAGDRFPSPSYALLICESLAQLTKLLDALSGKPKENLSYLTSLQIEFFKQVEMNDEVHLFARQEKSHRKMCCYRVEAHIDGEKLLSGSLYRKQDA